MALCSVVPTQENEILTEQEELISLEQVLRRQIATEKEEVERLRAEIADIQRSGGGAANSAVQLSFLTAAGLERTLKL